MTCRPHAATMNAVTRTIRNRKLNLRIMLSSMRLRDAGVAAMCGVALAAAFPKDRRRLARAIRHGRAVLDVARRFLEMAALLGWFAGLIFFAHRFRVGRSYGRQLHRRLRPVPRVRPGVDRSAVLCAGRSACGDRVRARRNPISRRSAPRPRLPFANGCVRSACLARRSINSDTRKPTRRCARSPRTPGRTAYVRVVRRSAHISPTRFGAGTWRPLARRAAFAALHRFGCAWLAWPARRHSAADDSGRRDPRQHRAIVQMELARARP